jgi:Aminotransferase class I and II
VADVEMQIVPLIVGEERAAMSLCQAAIERGVFAQAIRPPTVAAGSSRLRLTAMASHTPSELRRAASVLGAAARELGLDPEAMTPALPERELALAEHDAALERETELEIDLARLGARAQASVGGPIAPFDLERDGGEPAVAMAAASAPFDLERETSSARAA